MRELVSRYARETHETFQRNNPDRRYVCIDMHESSLLGNPAYVWEFEREMADRGLRHRRIVYFSGEAYGGALLFESAVGTGYGRYAADFRALEESIVETVP